MTAEQINAVVEKYGQPRELLKWKASSKKYSPNWKLENTWKFSCDTLGGLLEQAVKTLPKEEKRS